MKKFRYVVVLCFTLAIGYAQNIDIDLLRQMNTNRNTTLDPTFKSITNSAVPISIATPILLYSIGLIQHDSLIKQKAIFIGETFISSALITTLLKEVIKRERPYLKYSEIQPLATEGSYTMPSGHTSTSFATATSISMAYPKWYVIIPSFIWAGSVGYSRMHLGVHYPSDILIGALVGSGSAFLSCKANQWLNKKRKKN